MLYLHHHGIKSKANENEQIKKQHLSVLLINFLGTRTKSTTDEKWLLLRLHFAFRPKPSCTRSLKNVCIYNLDDDDDNCENNKVDSKISKYRASSVSFQVRAHQPKPSSQRPRLWQPRRHGLNKGQSLSPVLLLSPSLSDPIWAALGRSYDLP